MPVRPSRVIPLEEIAASKAIQVGPTLRVEPPWRFTTLVFAHKEYIA
jgi:hypothetical protein